MDFRENNGQNKPLTLFSQSSLTDIVLLLLIFFLLTSSFVTNFGIKVNVPKAETGTPANNQFIGVAITGKGEFYVASEPVSASMLASAIREEMQKVQRKTLVLRADKNARVDDAVRVMNIANALNLNVVMATERGTR